MGQPVFLPHTTIEVRDWLALPELERNLPLARALLESWRQSEAYVSRAARVQWFADWLVFIDELERDRSIDHAWSVLCRHELERGEETLGTGPLPPLQRLFPVAGADPVDPMTPDPAVGRIL